MPPSKRSADFVWRSRSLGSGLLLPVALLFAGLSALRRFMYRLGVFPVMRLPVPVVVVGNITAGGAGKTPLVLWLVDALRQRGRRPGVISRGYGGSTVGVREVQADSQAGEVGDEPLLIRRRAQCPVFVGRERVTAGLALLASYPECDVVICDDGLQHYRLGRDVEIAVVDRRGVGNGWFLPAGPLRESPSRLHTVDAVVANGGSGEAGFRMSLGGDLFHLLGDEKVSRGGTAFGADDLCLHAVAGIGEPQRFFDHLSALGLRFTPHAFPDHHVYTATDLDFVGDAILTTEKDAVKFSGLARLPVWVLPVTATVTPDLAQLVVEKIDGPASA